jgi:hypothetical protein
MYNIHSHYNNVINYVNKIKHQGRLGYFFPFGSTNFESIEFLGDEDSELLMLCFDQEPIKFYNNLDTFEQFDKTRNNKYSKYGTRLYSNHLNDTVNFDVAVITNKKLPVILLNTEQDSVEKNKLLNEFGYIDCYYFYHALAATDWFRGFKYCSQIIPIKERQIKKKFISYNRITGNSRFYRALFVSALSKKNLLNESYVSFSKECPVHGSIAASILHTVKENDLDEQFIFNELKHISTLPNLRIDSSEFKPIENSSFTINDIQKPIESFVNVVTETCFWETKKHLTEKIFKPIILKQPFILIGCANNLSYLKQYGFRTFDKWWNESYDQCQDPIQRINMVVDILEELSRLSNKQLHNILIDMEETLEYNFHHFYSQEFVDSIWKELTINLDSAIVQAEQKSVLEISTRPHHGTPSHNTHVLYQTDKSI